jgi:ribosomal L7/L12-like protein
MAACRSAVEMRHGERTCSPVVESRMLELLPIYLFLGVIAVFLLVARSRTDADYTRRLRRIEHRLQLVMDHLGVIERSPELPEVVRFLEEDKKIAAIKAYREATGAGLADAKRAVEAIAHDRGL